MSQPEISATMKHGGRAFELDVQVPRGTRMIPALRLGMEELGLALGQTLFTMTEERSTLSATLADRRGKLLPAWKVARLIALLDGQLRVAPAAMPFFASRPSERVSAAAA